MEFALTTGCSPGYVDKLKYTVPTWAYKPQFKNKKLYVFYNGVELGDMLFILEYFPNTTFIKWTMPVYDSMRELMLSSFILGVDNIKEDWFVKLDADTMFLNKDDVFSDEDLQYDLIAHPWSYTKPGWWVDKLDNWYNKTDIPLDLSKKISSQPRIISWCCLHKTEFVKEIARIAGDRLPVPSHDTYAWYMANRLPNRKWGTKNLKRRGVEHVGRVRSIREVICTNESSNNPMMNDMLLSHAQLEITTDCQIGCFNCDRNCGIAKSTEYMSVAQVHKFIVESILANKKWARIDIIGGEPTMHADIFIILDEVKIYKDLYPETQVRLSTNGLGPAVIEVLSKIPNWVSVRNSNKTSKVQSFESYNDAPIDHGMNEAPPCSIPWRCGLGLTRYGFFPCGAGASIARVFGLDIGIKSLSDLRPEIIKMQLKELCKYCGHSNTKFKHCTTTPEISKSWKEAILKYKDVKLGIY
jgi:hypothetical protein